MICKRPHEKLSIGIVLVLAAILLCLSAPVSAITAQEVLDKHIKALGGKEALAAVGSIALYSTVDYMEMHGTEISVYKFPGKSFANYDLGVYSLTMGFDGLGGWLTDANGHVREVGDAEIRPLINDLYLSSYAYILAGRWPGHTAYERDTTIQDNTYHILALYPDGGDSLLLLINSTTGLEDFGITTDFGTRAVIRYSDMRPVQGVMMPFEMSLSSSDAPFRIHSKIDSVTINPDLPDSIFAMPGAAGSDFGFPLHTDSTTIACSLIKDHLFVNVRVNGQGPFRFLLDSGSGTTVLSRRVADELGVTVSGSAPAMGVGGFGDIGFGRIDSISMGELTLHYSRISVAGFESLTSGAMPDFDGVLGYDFFARFPIKIDFADSVMSIYRPEHKLISESQDDIPLEIYCQLPVIQVVLDGQPLRMILDLGAQGSVVVRHNAPNFRQIMGRNSGTTKTNRIFGIGGSREVRTFTLDSLRIGSRLIYAPEVMALDSHADLPFPDYIEGIVGIGILKQFDLYLDYQRGRIVIDARK